MKTKTTKKCLITMYVFLVLYPAIGFVDNPIIPNQGVCDPHIHIFNGKAYLFATHDEKPGNTEYTMNDWWIWSSPDLINWTLEFTLDPQDTYIGGPWSKCYATDGAERNGKHYFYFSKHSFDMGVAVSTTGHGGPYTDALGRALNGGWDPTVFIDDDAHQTSYFIYGYYPYKIMKMNDDMISFAESPKTIQHIGDAWSADGSFVHKHNGLYYLNCHGSNYATYINVYGPYTHRGKFYPSWTDHGTFFEWNNQNYFAYGIQDTDNHFRKTNLTYAYYKDNGDLIIDAEIAQSSLGVGQYDSRKTIQAEWYFAASDESSKNENASGFEVRNSGNDSYLYYPNVKNIPANASASFCVSSVTGGTIEVREDSVSGTLLGSCQVPNTGSLTTYQVYTCNLANSAGDKNIALVFKGTGTELLRLDYFMIQDSGPTYTLTTSATNGSVNPAGGTFISGTVATLTAIPDSGYEFSSWSGDFTGSENPATITMNSDIHVTANFSVEKIFTTFAVNCGGAPFTSSDGTAYSQDTKYSGGNIYSTSSVISGTEDDVLYKTERYGNTFSYDIPMPNGSYEVTLMFAEIYHSSAGNRVLDVAIEGNKVISNLDIWSEVGKDAAYDEIFAVTLTDEVLNISFSTINDNAKISAIKVVPANGTGVMNNMLPQRTLLGQNYPNPFNPETTIPYQLNESSQVKLSIHNSLGQHVITLVDEKKTAGHHSATWNGRDSNDKPMASGIFIYRLETNNNTVQTKKFILTK